MPSPKNYGGVGSPLVNPPKFTPKRAPNVRNIDVPCPTCEVEAGEKCVMAGQPQANAHRARQRMARRRLNELRGL